MPASKPLRPAETFILVVSAAGVVSALVLITVHFGIAPLCPMFLGLPSCDFDLVAYAAVFVSVFVRWDSARGILFWSGAVLGLVPAVRFTIPQAGGRDICPTLGPVPLCYLSLAAFSAMIIVKAVFRRRRRP